jgi:hypothetical protein
MEAVANAANAARDMEAVANAANAAKHTEGVGDKRAGEAGEEDAMDLTYLVLLEVASYLCF